MRDEDLGLTWINLRHVHELVSTALSHGLEAQTGVGLSEAYVLFRLANAPSGCLRMGDLAGRLDMAQSGVTRLIDRLEERDWVVREQPRDNRRTTYARLTPAGRSAFERVKPVYARLIHDKLAASLPAADLADLRRLLRQVLEGLGACEEAPWACGAAEPSDGVGAVAPADRVEAAEPGDRVETDGAPDGVGVVADGLAEAV